jgi:hypothetical protein
MLKAHGRRTVSVGRVRSSVRCSSCLGGWYDVMRASSIVGPVGCTVEHFPVSWSIRSCNADGARQVVIAHTEGVGVSKLFFKNTGEVKDFSRRRGLVLPGGVVVR